MESDSSSSDEVEDGKCGALHCKIAVYKGLIVKWIQCACDSCDKYFHVYCVGRKHLKVIIFAVSVSSCCIVIALVYNLMCC